MFFGTRVVLINCAFKLFDAYEEHQVRKHRSLLARQCQPLCESPSSVRICLFPSSSRINFPNSIRSLFNVLVCLKF